MIKLDSNENQTKHYIDINSIVTNIDPRLYPDVTVSSLKNKISEHFNLPIEEIFCSNGSDNLIKILTFCLVSPNEEVLIPEVAFPTYEIAAKMKECLYTLVPLKNYGIDLEATYNAISEKTKLIWISNPHNPTGTIIKQDEIISFLEKVPNHIHVVLDEAYIEYLECDIPDTISIYKKHSNVIVIRTFSKAYGLAGARVGYGFAHPETKMKLELGFGPFDVNSYAQALASKAIEDNSYLIESRRTNAIGIKQYEDMCKELNFTFIKSCTPLIMIKFNDKCDELCGYLLNHNIVIKNGSKIGMPGWVRISIGTPKQNARIINLIKLFY